MTVIPETSYTRDDIKVADRRKAFLEKFRKSTKSPKTSYAWEFYLHRFMRHFICCQSIEKPPSDDPKEVKKFNRTRVQPMEYFYELLIDYFTPEQLQEMLIRFVMDLKEPRDPSTKKVRARSIETI